MADTNRGLGALTGGFQQGYSGMQKARRNRQYEKLMDQEIQQGERNLAGNEAIAAEASGMPTPPRATGLPDTYLERFTSWVGSKLGGAEPPAAPAAEPQRTAIPTDSGFGAAGGMSNWTRPGDQGSGATTSAYGGGFSRPGAGGEYSGLQSEYRRTGQYADGGPVIEPETIDPEKARKGAEASRAADRAKLAEDAAKPKSEPTRGAKAKAAAKKATIQGRSVVNSRAAKTGRVAKGGAATALGATAYDVWNTPTEDYRKRFGLELEEGEDPSLVGEMMIRGLGAASDLGNNMTFGLAGNFYRDKQDQVQAAEPQAQPGYNVTEPEGLFQPSTAAQPARRQAVNPNVGQDLPPPSEGYGQGAGGLDWRSANWLPDDMPTMPTKDWEKYRNTVVQARVLQGKSAAEAHQEVTAVQMQGFQRFGMEAAQLLQAGDPAAAARALKAAYQYFPNGADVKFGMQNDRAGQPALIGMGFDEQSGEPTGTPMLINAERMNAMLENLRDPGAWLQWTKDWRTELAADKKFEEVDKPAAQAKIETDRMAQQANLNRSEASLYTARNPAKGASGMKLTDLDRAITDFRGQLEMELETDNMQELSALASIMAQVYQNAEGQVDQATVYQAIVEPYRQGGLPAVREFLSQQGAEFDDGTP